MRILKDWMVEQDGFELPVPLVLIEIAGSLPSFVFSVGADRR